MATQLVRKRCDFGSLGVPGPASTPLDLGDLGDLGDLEEEEEEEEEEDEDDN